MKIAVALGTLFWVLVWDAWGWQGVVFTLATLAVMGVIVIVLDRAANREYYAPVRGVLRLHEP